MALQLRRGTDAERQGITPESGEPIWTTDTKELWIGDGSTAGGIAIGGAGPSGDSDQALYTTSSVKFANITATNSIYVGTPTNIIKQGAISTDLQLQSTLGGVLLDSNSGVFVNGTSRIHTDLVQCNNTTSNHLFRITDRDENSLTNFATDAVTVYPPLVSTTTATFNDVVKFASVAELRAQSTSWPFGENTATIMTIDTTVYGSARLNILVGATFGLDTHTERLTMDILTNGVDVLNAQSGVLATTSTGLCSYTAELSGTDILVKAVAIDPVNFLGFEAKTITELVAKPVGGLGGLGGL